jgi:hypothetical protein
MRDGLTEYLDTQDSIDMLCRNALLVLAPLSHAGVE